MRLKLSTLRWMIHQQNGMRSYGETICCRTVRALNVRELKVVSLITEHPRERAALLQHVEISGTTSRSRLSLRIALHSNEKRAEKNHPASDWDSPEEYNPSLNHTSRIGHGELHQRLHLNHHGRYTKGLKIHGLKKLRAADHWKLISTGTRKSKSFKQSAQLLKTNQESRQRNTLPTYNSPSKPIFGMTSTN